MKGASVSKDPPQVDITAPDGEIEVEYDRDRRVLYVHVEGFSCLRICQIKDGVRFTR